MPERGDHHQFANDGRGISALLRSLAALKVRIVVFEATGAYRRQLEISLAKQAVPFCKVNPRQSRRFAEAVGRLAKTDRVDAEWRLSGGECETTVDDQRFELPEALVFGD